jgi:hypothetical protein
MGDRPVELSSESVRARLKSLNSFRLRRRFLASFADPPLHSPASTASSSPPPSPIPSDLRETAGFSRMLLGKNVATSQGWRGGCCVDTSQGRRERIAFVSGSAVFADSL